MKFHFSRKQLAIPYAVFMLVFVIVPLFLILYYAFTDQDGKFILFSNFKTILSSKSNFRTIGRSILVGSLNTIFCILIAYPIAYILANKKLNKNKILVYIFIIPMWINFVIRTIATRDLLEYLNISSANHPLLATMIGMVYNYLPFAILPIYNTILKLDRNQIEASADLGANPVQVFIKTIIPMSMPGIVSAATMTFMPTMSSYVIADKLGGGKTTLIGNLISLYFGQMNYNIGSALSIIMLLMIIISLLITKNVQKDDSVRGNLW